MGRVMGVLSRKPVGYGYRVSLFGKRILQVKEEILEWDTNTGEEETRPVIRWRDAMPEEVVAFERLNVKEEVPEDEQRIRRRWYRDGVRAFERGKSAFSCLGSSDNCSALSRERHDCFKAGWLFARNQGKPLAHVASCSSVAEDLKKKSDFAAARQPLIPEFYAQELLKKFYTEKHNKKESLVMKINIKNSTDTIEVGKLTYGTYVTGIQSRPSTVYQKIDKRKPGQGVDLVTPKHHSLLMNVKLGSLRVVPGDTQVCVYEAELSLSRTTNFTPYLKELF